MHLSLISSISPPKLPVTFYTNVKIVARFNNVTQDPFTGLIANDDAKQLYVYNQKDSHGNPTKALFNKHLYQYLDDPTKCACFNVTYKDSGLPFFNHYKNFVKFAETDSDIIWKCTETKRSCSVSIRKLLMFPRRRWCILKMGMLEPQKTSLSLDSTLFNLTVNFSEYQTTALKFHAQILPENNQCSFPNFWDFKYYLTLTP